MNNSVQITPDSTKTGVITVHPSSKLISSSIKTVRFGGKTIPIKLESSVNQNHNQVSLSNDLIKELGIPMYCQFEVEVGKKGNSMVIGPFIGLMAGSSQESVRKRLHNLLDYLYHYQEINGAIVAFSLDKVNTEAKTIDGYLYNPKTKAWEEGVFPYPSSVFIMMGTVSTKWINHFQSELGDCTFNDFYLDKWEIHSLLNSSPKLSQHLPDSRLYEHPNDIFSFMKKHKSIILKSINASKGSKIYKLDLNNNVLDITYPKTGETYKINIKKVEEVEQFFTTHFEEREYMLQEALQLITYEKRTIDFRIIVLKNSQGNWKVMGMFARHGQPGNILSNISPKVKLGRETLMEVLKLKDSEVNKLTSTINEIVIEAVKVVEGSGIHFGNTGVDISINHQHNIHIIEVQHCNPSHDIAYFAGYPELYFEILKNNLLYAKKLAGFS